MARFKSVILKHSLKWHSWMGWLGGLALLLFALSGMTHPLMIWTGPQATTFFPPQTTFKAEQVAAIPDILDKAGVSEFLIVKMVPSAKGAVLQVTQSEDQPRRYFDLSTGEELNGFDKEHAIWLARYYTGLQETKIRDVVFQNEFDNTYPWVNRLLPIYKISFETDDNLQAFIYTELGALAGLTNDWKTTLQSVFQIVHTWSWLESVETLRIVSMLVFLLSLLALAVTGTAMIFTLKNRKMDKGRKFHRLLSYVVWVPVLLFVLSGTYHLLHFAYSENHRGLRLSEPVRIGGERFGDRFDWLGPYRDVALNGISLIEGPDQTLFYRLSIPQGRHGGNISKPQLYDGTPIEKPAVYFDALTGEEAQVSDLDLSLYYAEKIMGFDREARLTQTLVTHFGPDYDFRNKRLPVWQLSYKTDRGDVVFVDPATGVLVDRMVTKDRMEGYAFSFLHKWNILTPLIGRMPRDILVVLVLSLAVLSSLLGYVMLIKKQRKRRR